MFNVRKRPELGQLPLKWKRWGGSRKVERKSSQNLTTT